MYKLDNNFPQKAQDNPWLDQHLQTYYSPSRSQEKQPHSNGFYFDSVLFYIKEKLSVDTVIKEITFASIALATFLFMQLSGHLSSLQGFGNLIAIILISAAAFNLFKASICSLTPGLVCLVGGLVFLSEAIPHKYIAFLSNQSIEYIIGTGAFFIAVSLFKSGNYS